MATKTVKEWIAELDEPYRSQADLNTPVERETIYAKTLSDALKVAFVWSATPQGSNYWVSFHNLIVNGLWQKN